MLETLIERITPMEDGTIIGRYGRPLKPGFNKSNGYYSVNVSMGNGVVKSEYVHRLVAAKFHGVVSGHTVNHIDGNKGNNHKDNLEWLSTGDNTRAHSERLGYDQGVRDAILMLLGRGLTHRHVASITGVSKTLVGKIAKSNKE